MEALWEIEGALEATEGVSEGTEVDLEGHHEEALEGDSRALQAALEDQEAVSEETEEDLDLPEVVLEVHVVDLGVRDLEARVQWDSMDPLEKKGVKMDLQERGMEDHLEKDQAALEAEVDLVVVADMEEEGV